MWLARPVVFLSYSRQDSAAVKQLYRNLRARGFDPWMDVTDIAAGEWRLDIDRALRRAEIFIACLSKHTEQPGAVLQYEFDSALDIQRRRLEGDVFLVPVRLEDCSTPAMFAPFQTVDLFPGVSMDRLWRALDAKPRKRLRLPKALIATAAVLLLLLLADGYRFATAEPTDLLRSQRPGAWTDLKLLPLRIRPSSPPMLGVTFWRLTQATAEDSPGAKDWIHEAASGQSVQYTSKRINPEEGYRLGDCARVSVEATVPGYLYIVDQSISSGGRLGPPKQIFPSSRLRAGSNRIQPGEVIDIPQPGDYPEYIRIVSPDPAFAGDLLTFIWSSEMLDLHSDAITRIIPGESFETAVRNWGPQTRTVHAERQDTARTDAEKAARLRTRPLRASDAAPQKLFQGVNRPDTPLVAQIAMPVRAD
jgi:hypothetical protein